MFTPQDIEQIRSCRKQLERGFVDIKTIDKLLAKVESVEAPTLPTKKELRRAEIRARIESKSYIKQAR